LANIFYLIENTSFFNLTYISSTIHTSILLRTLPKVTYFTVYVYLDIFVDNFLGTEIITMNKVKLKKLNKLNNEILSPHDVPIHKILRFVIKFSVEVLQSLVDQVASARIGSSNLGSKSISFS